MELRQQKKWTQEELVERCNINVRTLQRIEAGEVTPREFTIRAIFSALEFQADRIEETLKARGALRALRLGWIAGIVYFLLGSLETLVDYWRFEEALLASFGLLYTAVKLLAVASFTAFMLGFAALGKVFSRELVSIAAYVMIAAVTIIGIYDVISLFSGLTATEFVTVKGIEAMIFGSADVLFGAALLTLRQRLGTVALLAGIGEVLVGICFITVLLAIPALVLLIPVTVLEIVLLYKAYQQLQPKGAE